MEEIKKLREITAKHFSIPDIQNPTRKIKYVEARALMYTLIRKYLGYTYWKIADMFNLTHASIRHGVEEFPHMVAYNKELKVKYDDILHEWVGGEPQDSNNELNLLQKKLKDLENENKLLNLSFKDLKKSVENMVSVKDDLNYNIDDVTKIFNYSSWTDKKKIDTLLQIDCNQYCNLGSTSTDDERNQVKRNSKIIYRTIRQIDSSIGKLLLTSMD